MAMFYTYLTLPVGFPLSTGEVSGTPHLNCALARMTCQALIWLSRPKPWRSWWQNVYFCDFGDSHVFSKNGKIQRLDALKNAEWQQLHLEIKCLWVKIGYPKIRWSIPKPKQHLRSPGSNMLSQNEYWDMFGPCHTATLSALSKRACCQWPNL